MAEPVVDALFIRKTEIRTVAAYPIYSVLVFSPYPNLTPHAPLRFSTCRFTAAFARSPFLPSRLPSESSTTHLFSRVRTPREYDEM